MEEMKSLIKFFLGVLLVIIISGCEEWPVDLFKVRNDSKDSVWVYIATGKDWLPLYPDTILPEPQDIYNPRYSIMEGLESSDGIKFCPPSHVVRMCYLPPGTEGSRHQIIDRFCADTISVFFIKKSEMDMFGYMEVRNKCLYVRYDLSKESLYDGHTIIYPPTLEMKEVKMWPSYSEIMRKINEE